MTQHNNGGPAFPQNTQVVANAGQVLHTGFMGGMTLRDYFAAKAMQGLMDAAMPMPEIAQAAYQMADDMLEARKL